MPPDKVTWAVFVQLVSSTVVGEAAKPWLAFGHALAPLPVAFTLTVEVDEPSLTVTVPLLNADEGFVLRIDKTLPLTVVARLVLLGVAV